MLKEVTLGPEKRWVDARTHAKGKAVLSRKEINELLTQFFVKEHAGRIEYQHCPFGIEIHPYDLAQPWPAPRTSPDR